MSKKKKKQNDKLLLNLVNIIADSLSNIASLVVDNNLNERFIPLNERVISEPKITPVKQYYKGAVRRFAPTLPLIDKDSELNIYKFEPLYLNLFTVDFKWPENFECSLSFENEIVSISLESMNKYRFIINFEDNLDENNEMIVYSTLLNAKDIVIPQITLSVFNRKGDVYLQYNFFNVKIVDIIPLEFSYKTGSKILRPWAEFMFANFNILYYGNKEPKNIAGEKNVK